MYCVCVCVCVGIYIYIYIKGGPDPSQDVLFGPQLRVNKMNINVYYNRGNCMRKEPTGHLLDDFSAKSHGNGPPPNGLLVRLEQKTSF